MSANSVLPPFGFTTRADSSENFAGIARNELSECHRRLPRLNRRRRSSRRSGLPSLPRLETSFEAGRQPVVLRPGHGAAARVLDLAEIARERELLLVGMSWSWKTSTAYLSMPASMPRPRAASAACAGRRPDLADEMRVKLADRDGHGCLPNIRLARFVWQQATPARPDVNTALALPCQALRAISPPSTGITAPVRNEAAGRHRLRVMCATSSGSP